MIDDTHLWELKRKWEERRRALGIKEPPTDLASLNLELRHQRLQTSGKEIPRDIGRYKRFPGSPPRFPFTFLYPEAWEIQEIEEEPYYELFILGPKSEGIPYNLALIIHTAPAQDYASLEEFVNAYLLKGQRHKGFHRMNRVEGMLGNARAVEIEVGYSIEVEGREISVVERCLVIKPDSTFYKLVYRASEEDYQTYLPSFKALVRTFEPTAEIPVETFQPILTR